MRILTFLRRLAAFFYDSLLLLALLILATFLLLPFTHGEAITPGNHFYQIYLLAIIFSFYAFFLLRGGQTLGMLVWGLQLVSISGEPIKFWQILLRFFGALLTLPFFACGFLWQLLDKDGCALYDRLSLTKVNRV